MPRKSERLFILGISIVLGALFYTLFNALQSNFKEVSTRTGNGIMLNLNDKDPGNLMTTLLQKGYYFEDRKDIALIAKTVTNGVRSFDAPIDNIGELNKRRFFVNADEAYLTGGKDFKKRVTASRSLLGYTGDDANRFIQEAKNPPQLPAVKDLTLGEYRITGKIINVDKDPVAGVLVRLTMILPQDSAYSDNPEQLNRSIPSTYVRTDASGSFEFRGLPNDKAFEILPLQPGFQFGRSQGVQELKENADFVFKQAPHTIRLFSAGEFKILKKEKSLIVRTPDEYNTWYWIIVGCFFFGFLVLHLLLSVKFPQADQLIVPVIMIMTGLSFITLLSLQDPLRDRFLAKDTLIFFAIGILGICMILGFKLRKFNVDSRFYRMFILNTQGNKANGWQWAGMALALLALTIVFGSGPEGSGVKVNLFGIQPSEIVKYGIILFLAGFFASNEKFITEYRSWQKRWYFFSFALAAMLIAILMYLVLGDLGPAMVVCFTFIILFSFSRGDFSMMLLAIIVYTLTVWFLNIWLASLITAVLVTLAMVFNQKKTSESAIMVIMVIAGFLLIDQIPYLDKLIPGPVNRLSERKSIWQDPWNNEVYGGDQVANGIWAMAGGGVSGQGVGEGFAKTIPEAHTDMILPAIGEEFGWTAIVGVFILFLIFLNRSIIIGRQTGTPFLFYVCAGIGISMFVQFLLIAGGSTGALPLSGVALPFISYGGSSLVANFIAAGFLLSASLVRGTPVQMAFITKQQDKNLVPALLSASVAVILLAIPVTRYILDNKKWIVQPALVADRSGARMFSYNPRIAILMDRLEAGQLYDRNGHILATSNPELIRKQRKDLTAAGITYNLDSAVHKRVNRYYPFEAQTFFWTGDANTGVFNGSTNGYFAEYEHAAELRGFHSPVTSFNTRATKYREDRFLPRGVKEMNVSRRDYAELAPLLIAGINSSAVDAFKKRNRNVKLTIDARLQASIQHSMSLDDSLKKSRVSVVIMEDITGDVLSSAVYPLPPVKDWDLLNMTTAEQNKLSGWYTNADLGFTYATQPGSTAKVLTAMAAFNKLGLAATEKTFNVTTKERIRTKGIEPDETGKISLERAIVNSNNVYFIKLANEEHLEENMANLYLKTGMFLRGVGGYYFDRDTNNIKQENKWLSYWRKTEFNTKPKYDPSNIRRTRAKGISGMSWGQGELIATPASVARLASGVANKGILVPNRYVLKISDSATAVKPGIKLANDPKYAALLTDYMLKQSANKSYTLGLTVAGKTGTPERIWKQNSINDGWYVFFAPRRTGKGHIVVCIRIESTRGSSKAVLLAGQHVVPALKQLGYIKDFKKEIITSPKQSSTLNF
ncbi:FtsW/RodA/SpoVE family cell cycle protein [Pedobacter metabolipauper]|uniref:Cell division protein FtsW (Lipid II flippase) n=1 Tax=Pedobacter metabolipauper TaxID=425513 RepID=A0A4R6SQX1_9SPHI|nr:FtsW/RodA/SpoVE family cell cycle protein [Pedobacter metabolipauper]TDQ07360.1 cell division protein FtsW (lipid II flippase) [Pedobacter metabolipauper]